MAAKLDIVIGAVDKASGTLNKVGGASGKMGAAMKKGALVGGAALVGLTAAAIKFGSDFESAFNTIKVGTGASGEALEGLKEDFKAALAKTPADMKTVSQATADLNTRLGLTGKPLQDMTLQFVELSRITGTDASANIEKVTRLFGDWAVSTEDQEGQLDRLFKTSQATGIGVDKLSSLVVQFGAPLRGFGFDLDEATAILAKFDKEGVNTEAVMGGLKIGLGKVAAAGKNPTVELWRVSEAIKNAGSMGEANVAAIEMFGSRAGPDMAAAIREGRFEVGDFIEQMDKGGEGIMATAEATRTWQEKLQILRNKALVKLEPVLTGMVNGLGSLADTISNDVLPAVEEWWKEHGPGLVATVKEVAGYLRDFFAPALDTLVDLWDNLKGPIKAVGQLLINNKEILLVVAVAILALVAPWLAVAAAIAVILAKWDEISAFFIEIGERVKKFVADAIAAVEEIPIIGEIFEAAVETIKIVVKAAFDIIKNRIETVIKAIREIIQIVTALIRGDWEAAWGGIKNLGKVILTGIKTEINLILNAIRAVIWTQLTMIGGVFSDAWRGIKTLVLGIVTNLKTELVAKWTEIKTAVNTIATTARDEVVGKFNAVKTGIETAINGAHTFLTGLPSKFKTAMNTLGTAMKDGLIEGFKGTVGALGDLAGQMWDALKGIINSGIQELNDMIPDKISIKWKGIGKDIDLPNNPIPSLATGGRVLESGLAVIHRGETVVPARDSGAGVGAGGGGTIIVNVSITTPFNLYHPAEIEAAGERLAQVLRRKLR